MTTRKTSTTDRVLRVLDYIHANTDRDLSLDQLADVAAMSRFHWHRVFTATLGAPPGDIIRSVRLHKASMLLVQTTLPVAEVAARVGYTNPRSFGRAFRDSYGFTPGAFRKRARITALNIAPGKGDPIMYPVDLTERAPVRAAAVAHTGPYAEISKAFQKLGTLLGAGGHWPRTAGMIGVYYDDPHSTAPEALRSHAGAIWTGQALPDGLEELALVGGRHAVMHFKGPYAGLPAAYNYLYGTWLAEAGASLRDAPSWEFYVNSPMDTAPEDLLTDICVPLV